MLLRYPTFDQILKLIWLISGIENKNFYSNIPLMDAHGSIRTREWQIWWGCGLNSPRSDRIKSPMLHIHTHTDTSIPKAINTDACTSATPHHTLWHTDWLIPWWARLWHTDCATLQQQRPPSPLSPSLPAPPCIHAVFSREALPHIPPSISTPPSSSGGWKWGWGAGGKGQEENVWRALWDLTQFWGARRPILVFHTSVQFHLFH